MDKYLILYSDTFLWYDETYGVLYNCKYASFLKFDLTSLLLKYCIQLNCFDNMYTVKIDPEDEKDTDFSNWLNQITTYQIGEIKETNNNEKIFSFPPILNLQNEIEERRMNDENYRSTNIANNFHEVTFFLGGENLTDEEEAYSKQILYPISTTLSLSVDDICSFLDNNNIEYLRQINIVCNKVYPEFENLFNNLVQYGIPLTYYFLGNKVDFIEKLSGYSSLDKISLGIYFYDIESFKEIEAFLSDKKVDYQWLFLLHEENELDKVEEIINLYHITCYKLLPVLTNSLSNLSFFENNVFTSLDDLSQLTLSKQNIFCNQTINSNNWGQLFITPDKCVYANLNGTPIGTINENILHLIRKEMTNDSSFWKCTREKVSPCKKCIYRNLCPPPSNYEFFSRKFNLCTIFKSSEY